MKKPNIDLTNKLGGYMLEDSKKIKQYVREATKELANCIRDDHGTNAMNAIELLGRIESRIEAIEYRLEKEEQSVIDSFIERFDYKGEVK
jgi:hypothetical protein